MVTPWQWVRLTLGRGERAAQPYRSGDLSQELRFVVRAFGILVLCYLGTLVWGAFLSRESLQLEQSTAHIYDLGTRVSELKAELNSNFLFTPDSMENYVHGGQGHPSELAAGLVIQAMQKDPQVMRDEKKRALVQETASTFQAYSRAFAAIVRTQRDESTRDATASLGPSMQTMLYVGQASDALLRIEQNLQQLHEMTEAQRAHASRLMYTGVIIGSALLVLSLWGLGFLISRTRRQANEAMVAAVVASREAEAENENLNNSAIGLLHAMSLLADRDLTARAAVTQDIIGTVADSVNGLAEKTQYVLRGVSEIAEQVRLASTKARGQAQLVQETAEGERVRVVGMTQALHRATQVMVEVAEMASRSNVAANQATQETENALSTVESASTGMEAIRSTIAETEKRIKRLGERSQEISGIVSLINTIAERTHVLALNAAMQAAVAGEAGRGFAVVAEEVQRLAESSRAATQQIATLVSNIQMETNEAITTVNRTIGQVVQGSEQAQKAGEQMRRTQHITTELVAQVRNIAGAAEAQKNLSHQLLESVRQIGESTEQTGLQIREQNEQTEHLQEAARQLVQAVGIFHLGAGDAPSVVI